MRTITAGQLRARLGEALDRASAGERIVIERDHHRIAALVPIEDAQQLDDGGEEARRRKRAAMARIRERARQMREPETGDDAPDAAAWVRWDRDHGHEDEA
jgi:antitoxin (DNA-binding transcriptional repressor) of toxin-antitoxin stability system